MSRLSQISIWLGGIAIVAFLGWMFIDMSNRSEASHVTKALVSLRDPPLNHPGPEATSLQLAAGGLTLCFPSKEPQVARLKVDQTGTAVVIRASVKVYEGEDGCEETQGGVDLNVALDRPLGQRQVVDESQGIRRVIWSPAMRQMVLRALAYSTADAERFLAGRFPGTHKQTCARFGVRLFACSTRYPGQKRLFFHVLVSPAGKFYLRRDPSGENPNFPPQTNG
jgi:hypothetical protein